MKIKFKAIIAALGIISIISPSIYAVTNIEYNFKPAKAKYKVILDGQSYQIPDSISFDEGNVNINTEFLKQNLQVASDMTDSIEYSNGTLTYLGNFIQTTVSNEYVPIVGNTGLLQSNIDYDILKNYFEKNELGSKLHDKAVEYIEKLQSEEDESKIKEYTSIVNNFNEEIRRINNLKVENIQKDLISTIPCLGVNYNELENIGYNPDDDSVSISLEPTYYLYSIIFRDLRVLSMRYNINNSDDYVYVPDFDKDTYTYTIKLDDNVPDNATITTSSVGYMNSILEQENLEDSDLNISVQDDTIQLVNGMGTATVKVVYDMYASLGEYADTSFTTNPEREYTIYFTKYDFIKGDLDRNGAVNSDDAAIALDLYRYGNVSAEDLQIGDMDENGLINSDDAALILDVYRYGY